MKNTTLVSIVLGITLTLLAGWMVADSVGNLSDSLQNHNNALIVALQCN